MFNQNELDEVDGHRPFFGTVPFFLLDFGQGTNVYAAQI